MRFYCSILFVLPVLFTLAACQSLPDTEQDLVTQNNVINKFPLSTAVQIDYQDEVKLLRINQLLVEQKDLDVRQRAVLFYERGVIYDRMLILPLQMLTIF